MLSASRPDAVKFWVMPPLPVTPNYLLAHLVPSEIGSRNNASFVSDNSGECWFQIIRSTFRYPMPFSLALRE